MNEEKNTWCLIPQEIWTASDINLQEKCLLGRIFSLAISTGKCFSSNQYLANELCKSKVQIDTMLRKLEKLGYIERTRIYKRNSKQIDSRLITHILKLSIPILKNKDTPTLKNKEDRIDILEKNIDNISIVEPKSSTEINKLIKLFEPINPSYKTLFGNNTQRKALERLLKEHGLEKVESMIKSLPEVIIKPYAPRVTTPLQLEQKLGELVIFTSQERNKNVRTNKFAKME